jgi:hypothetical protein
MTAEVGLELPKTPRRRPPKRSLPAFRPFQLCTLTTTIPVGSNWLFEIKFDGYRVHVVVPLVPKADWSAVKDFCQSFAKLMAKSDPERFVANMSMARRKGRMFLDYLRNGQGATAICPWSTRARAGGSVAVPVTWDELGGIDRANGFDIFAAAARAQAMPGAEC